LTARKLLTKVTSNNSKGRANHFVGVYVNTGQDRGKREDYCTGKRGGKKRKGFQGSLIWISIIILGHGNLE